MAKHVRDLLKLDDIDHRIIAALTDQGRISNAALARDVGLSESATLERVRRLEKTGVIVGYSARIIPEALGRGTRAVVHLRLENRSLEDVVNDLLAAPWVESCVSTVGSCDLIIHIAGPDLDSTDRILKQDLRAIQGVKVEESLLVTQVHKS